MLNLFNVNNKGIRATRHGRHFGVFIIIFEQSSGVSILDFEQINVGSERKVMTFLLQTKPSYSYKTS